MQNCWLFFFIMEKIGSMLLCCSYVNDRILKITLLKIHVWLLINIEILLIILNISIFSLLTSNNLLRLFKLNICNALKKRCYVKIIVNLNLHFPLFVILHLTTEVCIDLSSKHHNEVGLNLYLVIYNFHIRFYTSYVQ